MGTTLSTLKPSKGANRKRKRVGRGPGSGTGKTAGRGQKGQKARKGSHGGPRRGYEGGQMPLHMRLPKRGFNNIFREEAFPINVGELEKLEGEVNMTTLRAAGLIPKSAKIIKILGDGDLTKKFTVSAHRFSKTAKEKIEKAGGTCQVIEVRSKAKAEGNE